MLIRKNTKEHSAIFEVLKKYESKEARKTLIQLFTIKAGEGLDEKKPVEDSKGLSDLYYNLNYNSILNNLLDKDHQLNKDDNQEDLYYFESNYSPVETPFQVTEEVLNEINSLIKDKKFKARAPKDLTKIEEKAPVKESKKSKENKDEEESKNAVSKLKVHKESAAEIETEKVPAFNLKYPLEFSSVNKQITEDLSITKLDVLDYYNTISEQITSFTKDRPLFEKDLDNLLGISGHDHPDWLKTVNVYMDGLDGEFILGQNKEHILYLVENEMIELQAWTSKNKNFKNPDNLVIRLTSEGEPFEAIVKAGQTIKEILEICGIEGYAQSNGEGGLLVVVPLDGKSEFRYSKQLADILSKLASRKAPGTISLKETEKDRVFLDTSINGLGKTSMVPYSINKRSFFIAAPILWEELNDDFDHKKYTIREALKRAMEEEFNLVKIVPPAINAKEIYEKLETRYGFLLD